MSIQLSGGHYYDLNGEPRHFVGKKDGSGLRPTTIADARKNGWLPSPTTILGVLNKPALTEWHKRNAILAALTTPRLDGEDDDCFASRVLRVDAESISNAAKDLGTQIHNAIEGKLNGSLIEIDALAIHVEPVIESCKAFGRVVFTEKVLVGDGYAGRTDAAFESDYAVTIVDFKTTGAKVLPKKSYNEHKYQLASYAKAFGNSGDKRIQTANIYISTVRPGEVSVCINEDWEKDFEAFNLTRRLWGIINNYEA